MSTQIKKSAIDGLLGTYDILVGAIEPAGVTVPTISNPKRRGIISCCPKGIHISVGSTPVWKMIGVSGGSTDSTFTVSFKGLMGIVNSSRMLEGGVTQMISQAPDNAIIYSENDLFDPVSADSDGIFTITMDKQQYKSFIDSGQQDAWRLEFDNEYSAGAAHWYGYYYPAINTSDWTLAVDNEAQNYIILDGNIPAQQSVYIGLSDDYEERSPTVTLDELVWVVDSDESIPVLDRGVWSSTTSINGYFEIPAGTSPYLYVFIHTPVTNSEHAASFAAWCIIKIDAIPDDYTPEDIYLYLPGEFPDNIDMDEARNQGWNFIRRTVD